mmetsp:Transcript_15499/g.37507  ORF Transcript_15499/g.37507 Transcript_15499/m.37507 type:complete len:106 (-) Transcript_15499:1732-2049(-)
MVADPGSTLAGTASCTAGRGQRFSSSSPPNRAGACYHLGSCFTHGCGVERNVDDAKVWYAMAYVGGTFTRATRLTACSHFIQLLPFQDVCGLRVVGALASPIMMG